VANWQQFQNDFLNLLRAFGTVSFENKSCWTTKTNLLCCWFASFCFPYFFFKPGEARRFCVGPVQWSQKSLTGTQQLQNKGCPPLKKKKCYPANLPFVGSRLSASLPFSFGRRPDAIEKFYSDGTKCPTWNCQHLLLNIIQHRLKTTHICGSDVQVGNDSYGIITGVDNWRCCITCILHMQLGAPFLNPQMTWGQFPTALAF